MDLYGQPTGPAGYDIIDSPIFACWMPVLAVVGDEVRHPFEGGYKLHLSVDPEDAERVAQHVLPVLQDLRVDHKVVFPVTAYVAMNEGEQRGKFITVYPGPGFATFTSLVGTVDRLLMAIAAKPALGRCGGWRAMRCPRRPSTRAAFSTASSSIAIGTDAASSPLSLTNSGRGFVSRCGRRARAG